MRIKTGGFLERQMDKLFEALGVWITKHPLKVILLCTSLTAICFVEVATTKKETDLLAYAPPDARSRHEFANYQEFFGQNGQGIMIYVMIQAKDNGSMIRVPHLNETVRVLDHIGKTFKIHNQSFEEFCTGFCQLNEPLRQFYNGLFIQESQLKVGAPLNGRIHLKYPVTSMFSRKFSIQANFFGVELFSNETMLHQPATNMKNSQLVVLQFRAEKLESWSDQDVIDYERSIAHYYMNEYGNELIDVLVINLSYVSEEIERNGLTLQPLLVIGFIVMCAFTILTTVVSSVNVRQPIAHKILLSLIACIVPLMACVTAFGLAFLVGLRFSPLIMVTPFLVLAIGVDDSFLMTFHLHKCSKKQTPIEERITKVCTETGASVCLSSITNILAFLVGSLCATPEIQLFNIVNSIALTVDLIYSLTLYVAILVIYLRNEHESEDLPKSAWQLKTYEKVSNSVDSYVRFLANTWVCITVPFLLVLFWAISLNGALQMDVDLSSGKFFLKDSKLLKADELKQNYVTPTFTALLVIVNNPGNLSDITRLKELESMVTHLEGLQSAIGRDSTKLFLHDYLDYLASFVEMDEEHGAGFDAESLEHFLAWPEYSFWRGFLKLTSDTQRPGRKQLGKFFFTTGYNGELLREWTKRHQILNEWRSAIDRFPDFNASIYYDDSLFLDLISVLPSSTWQSVAVTLLCMIIVCYLFISEAFTVFLTSLSIFSICLGEFGLLYYCGVTLDPISMAALIMTIGFSVDLPCHVGYHFYKTEYGQSVEERLRSTLLAVGYPVVQAGLSTILCLVTLLLAPLYMSKVFVLSMTLCVSLSLFHALFLLPVILCLKDRVVGMFRGKKQTISPHILSLGGDKY